MSKFTDNMTQVLQLTIKHKSYLEKNPKHLALLMKEYDELHYSSRYHDDENIHDWNNLKYAVIDLEDVVDPEYASMVYDAWASTRIDDDDGTPESWHPLERKTNKTMDEIVEMCLDPKYRYNSIFPNKKAVLSHYLCTLGSGLCWNKNGFIGEKSPSGESSEMFDFYWEETLPFFLQEELTWLNDEEINKCKQRKKKAISDEKKKREDEREKHKQEMEKAINEITDLLKGDDLAKFKEGMKNKAQERIEAELTAPYYPIHEEYALICHIPENAHPSYVTAAIEVCNDILQGEKESEENKKVATKLLKKLQKRVNYEKILL